MGTLKREQSHQYPYYSTIIHIKILGKHSCILRRFKRNLEILQMTKWLSYVDRLAWFNVVVSL